jgi:hypothetical protein
MDIDSILNSLNDNNTDISDLTYNKIKRNNSNILKELSLDNETLEQYIEKLMKYRYVDEINNLKIGSYIRWININETNPKYLKLHNGGRICNIFFTNNDTCIRVYLYSKFITSIRLNDVIIFQKLSKNEEFILNIIQQLHNDDSDNNDSNNDDSNNDDSDNDDNFI